MAGVDPRTPVLVGVGELTCGSADEVPDDGPPAMMAEAVRRAASDAGAGDALLRRVGAVAAVPSLGWADGDPARRVAELLGLEDVATLRSSLQGGNGPGLLVGEIAARIGSGSLDAAVVCGAEALATLSSLQKEDEEPRWPAPDGDRAAGEVLEGEHAGDSEVERAIGVGAPVVMYPLIENAIRAAAGTSVEEHLGRICGLWSRFSDVAAEHPYAWSPTRRSAAELATASGENRAVTFPYLKLLNADIQVDQAAALLLCSAGVAAGAGVPRERWVFPVASAGGEDEWLVSERRELHRSPAIAACGRALFGHAGCGADDIGHVDLYSCFPAAVELGARELGLPLDDPDRPLTETGGLTFFGGPGNNYSTHGMAAVARRLREGQPGELGLASALGWYATKHALVLLGNRPPVRPFAAAAPDFDPVEPRAVVADGDHEATVETCTVVYERDGTPSYGVAFALLEDGRRGLARTTDADLMREMTTDGFLGSRVRLGRERSFTPA